MAKFILSLLMVTLVATEQPGAPVPVVGPQRDLPWGQLNFLHTTDVHGWHAGHLQEAQYSADWGDYVSFSKKMREKADAAGVDLIVVDTGDRVNGNGLYDASDPVGLYTYDIIKKMNIDILVPGNHELYFTNVVDDEYWKLASSLKENYIASNLDYIDPKTGKQVPMAQRYRIFRTKNQGIKVAAFGFMFTFDMYANNSYVQPIELTVKESWFQSAIQEDVDLFLICAHIPLRDPEFETIIKAIRSKNPDTPIHTFGSHSHVRDFKRYDSNAYGLQSGRYLETIGWSSINGIKKNINSNATNEVSFRRRYIDNNVLGYYFHSGLNASTFHTEYGKNVSLFIQQARKNLDLDYKFGCAPRNLYLRSSHIPRNDSIVTWMEQGFLPDTAKMSDRTNVSSIIILNTKFFRFHIIKGAYTRDTIYISTPFINQFRFIKDVPYKFAKDAYRFLNESTVPDLRKSNLIPPDPEQIAIQSRMLRSKITNQYLTSPSNRWPIFSSSKPPELTPGYVTHDDGGSDGDDTLHAGYVSHPPPEYMQSSVRFPAERDPEFVDFIFCEFLQTPILNSFKSVGLELNESSVAIFNEENIGDMIAQWVQKNWPCE